MKPHPNPNGHGARNPHDDSSSRPEDAPQRGRRRGPGRETGRGTRRGSGRGPGGPGRRRTARGDVRAAILRLLAEEPMHGYQIMEAIAERSGGRWTPSPGAVYPAINQLEDEGLVTVTSQSGRKVATLTDAGREAQAGAVAEPDPFLAAGDRAPGHDLRGRLADLHQAAREVGRNGTDAQVDAAAKILSDARRSLYLLLADSPETTDD